MPNVTEYAYAGAEAINQLAGTFADAKGLSQPRPLTEADLTRIRSRMADLFARWNDLPSGSTLELAFPLEPPLTPSARNNS